MKDIMLWAAAILVPMLTGGIGALITARHSRGASDHSTNVTALVSFNHDLLEERKALLEGMGIVRNQVTNGHKTNLRDDLTAALQMIGGVVRDVGALRDELRHHIAECQKP